MKINSETFFERCGVLYLDHVAVTTKDLMSTLTDYLKLSGSRLLKGPNHNTAQKVDYAFVQLQERCVIEILVVKNDSPIHEHVRRGGGAYHLCYAVKNITDAVLEARNQGAVLVSEPRREDAFDGRCVCFMKHALHGLIEFVEAYPAELTMESQAVEKTEKTNLEHASNISGINIEENLMRLFQETFPEIEFNSIPNAEAELFPYWDSMGHINLIMGIENTFNLKIPVIEMQNLLSFSKILRYVESKTDIQ